MKVINVKELSGTSREVKCPDGGFTSLRPILKRDGMGYSITITTIYPEAGPQIWHYKRHLESCYCVSGNGLLLNMQTGEIHNIHSGVIYILDNHDKHQFTALTKVELVCVFNPPLFGNEIHKKDRSY